MKSFAYAGNGIRQLWRQPNIRIHAAATVFALSAGWLRHLDHTQWAIVAVCIAGVWITEAINTSIEQLCDLLHPGHHPVVKSVKDIAAAAVLFSAILSIIVFLLIIL
jgi:diacylglycerol kinase (ATP)